MAYRFRLNEPLTKGVRRIGLAQLELAERRLKAASDPAVAVHEVRKSLKRLRSLLRLVRPALGEKTYRRESVQLRDAGRALAAARDNDVLRQTIAKLEASLPEPDRALVARLRPLLDANGAGRSKGAHVSDLRKAKSSILAAKRRFARLKAEPDGFAMLQAGLRRSYRAGKRALALASKDAEEEVFHELRKAVQQHWRQMLLLTRAWPEVCKSRAASARAIAQLLGDEHDYALLAAFVASHRGTFTDAEVATLQQICRSQQHDLRAQAIPQAQRLFADGATTFAERMGVYWAAARDLQRLEAAGKKPEALDNHAKPPAGARQPVVS
jgi:CHAD domain-containing protein